MAPTVQFWEIEFLCEFHYWPHRPTVKLFARFRGPAGPGCQVCTPKMGTHGGQWGPIGTYMGAYGGPLGPMGAYGDLWGPSGAMGSYGDPMGAHGDLWGPMGTLPDPWGSMGAYGVFWGHLGTYGDLCGVFQDSRCLVFSQLFHVGLIFPNPLFFFLDGGHHLFAHPFRQPPSPLPPSIRPISGISHMLLHTLQTQHATSHIHV